MNFGYVVFELLDGAQSLGAWVTHLTSSRKPLVVTNKPKNGRSCLSTNPAEWQVMGATLRPEREYLPYSIELLGIANEFYQGTEIPFNFESEIILKTEGSGTGEHLSI